MTYVDMADIAWAKELRYSRPFYRRSLASAIVLELIQEAPNGQLSQYHFDAAQFIEDLANAITERLAAREEKELAELEVAKP